MNSHTSLFRSLSALFAFSVASFAVNAHLQAGTILSNSVPTITISSDAAPGASWQYAPSLSDFAESAGDDGSYALSSDPSFNILKNSSNQTTSRLVVQDLEFNPDPFVLNNILVTNTTATTQIYSVTVGLPTAFGAPNLISGTVTSSVIDGGGGGATLSTATGQSIYKAQIDFGTVATLQNDPFSVSTPGSNSASASFGPMANGIPVTANIGIVLTFQLTAGDTAALLSRFDVLPIPEPTSLVLSSVLTIAGLAVRRR